MESKNLIGSAARAYGQGAVGPIQPSRIPLRHQACPAVAGSGNAGSNSGAMLAETSNPARTAHAHDAGNHTR